MKVLGLLFTAFRRTRARREVPEGFAVVSMTPLGYPASPALIHPLNESRRKDPAEIFSTNGYEQ